MATTHIYPFDLTRDDTWRETTTTTIQGPISQPCSQLIYSWDGSSPTGEYSTTSVNSDDPSIDEALAQVLYRLSSRFNSDPKFSNSFEVGCPKPVNVNSLSRGFNPNERREFNHRTRKWQNVPGDPRVSSTKPKKTLVRKPNALLSKLTERLQFGGSVLLQRREIRPGWHEGDPIDNKYIYVIDCVYEGNLAKAQEGTNPGFLNTYVAPLLNVCQTRNLWTLYADLRAAADEKALRSIYVKLKDQKVDLATQLAEGAQTVSLIADMSTRLAKFLLHLKKLRLDQAASDLLPIVRDLLPLTRKKAANDFLAYRYGISPLINDIQGLAEQLAEYVLALPKTFVRSRATISSVLPESTYAVGDNWQYTESGGVEVIVKYKVTFQWQPFDVTALEKLGFTNPANVIWELTPFSFVVDWFLPIGNFLNTVSSADNLTVVSVERLTHIIENRNVQGFRLAASSGEPAYILNGGVSASQRETLTVREILPLPSLPLPSFKNPLSKGHVANAIALISQLVK